MKTKQKRCLELCAPYCSKRCHPKEVTCTNTHTDTRPTRYGHLFGSDSLFPICWLRREHTENDRKTTQTDMNGLGSHITSSLLGCRSSLARRSEPFGFGWQFAPCPLVVGELELSCSFCCSRGKIGTRTVRKDPVSWNAIAESGLRQAVTWSVPLCEQRRMRKILGLIIQLLKRGEESQSRCSSRRY